MAKKTKLAIFVAVSLLAMMLLSVAVPQVQAEAKVKISFAVSGGSTCSGVLLTIDGTDYYSWNLPSFQWKVGSTHKVTAAESFKGWDSNVYKFATWTNGNGLTANSGTFTTPSSAKTVTANYQPSTHLATFAASGLSNFDGQILKIDGESYLYSSLATTSFRWEEGSTHTVEALTPLYSWDTPAKGFTFSSWTNGNGLTTASGTFTMPTSDVAVTANYAQSTVQVLFRLDGLSNLNSDTVLTIDDTPYNYWDVLNTNFQWTTGSSHTITAASPLTGWDSATHYFSSWTNGNGLTETTGTFTVPSSDVTVTANYDSTPPSQAGTTLTIACSEIDENRLTTVYGALTSSGSGVEGKTVTLTYFDGASWNSITTTTTAPDGTYTYDWTVPQNIINGVYPVKADFAGDSNYQSSTASTGSPGNGPDLTVLPESAWGSLVAFVACFGGALVFFKMRAKRSHA